MHDCSEYLAARWPGTKIIIYDGSDCTGVSPSLPVAGDRISTIAKSSTRSPPSTIFLTDWIGSRY